MRLSLSCFTGKRDYLQRGVTKIKKVDIFTDGACSGNPGPGGWGAILRYGENEKEISGGEKDTTNNRMEMTAVIEALKLLKFPCEVTLYTDSQYVCNGINKRWIDNWQRNGWKNSQRQPVANKELWEEIIALMKIHNVKFVWVKGHDGHPENERCDRLAVEQSAKFK